MMDEYMSNLTETDIGDVGFMDKIESMEKEMEELKKELDKVKKENLERKLKIQDMEIESSQSQETIRNQQGLINFYKQFRTDEEGEIEDQLQTKELQKEIEENKRKIKDLEDSLAVKTDTLEKLNNEMKEQSELNEKLINMISEKDEEMKKMNVKKDNPEAEGAELPEDVDSLKLLVEGLRKEKEDLKKQYDEKLEGVSQNVSHYQTRLSEAQQEINLLEERNKILELEKTQNKKEGTTEADNKNIELSDDVETLQNKIRDLKESKKLFTEKAEKQREADLHEIFEMDKTIQELKETIKNLEAEKKRNEYNVSNNEIIITNYKNSIEKKKREIENLTSKCKEFKENLDHDEKEKEEILEKYGKEKTELTNKIKDLESKLEMTLREFNDLRVQSGKGATSIDEMKADPKQKLYEEIAKNKEDLEKYVKENEELKKKVESMSKRSGKSEAENQFVQNTIESYKKNIEELKALRARATEDFKKELEKSQIELGKFKCQLAMREYDFDRSLIKYRNYIRKLQAKLESLGIKFKKTTKGLTRSKTNMI